MKSKKVIHSKPEKRKPGRPKGAKNKVPPTKATDGLVLGQIFYDFPEGENPLIKAMRENLQRGGGRPRSFASPKAMLEAMEAYVRWAKEHPIKSMEVINGLPTAMPLRRPITLGGYCLYCGVTESYLRGFKNTVKDEPGFITVINTITQYINDDLFEGAAVGQFNANLISKKLGLADNLNVNGTGGIQPEQVAALFPFKRPASEEPKQLES